MNTSHKTYQRRDVLGVGAVLLAGGVGLASQSMRTAEATTGDVTTPISNQRSLPLAVKFAEPASGNVATAAATGTPMQVFNVLDYGATGDGVHDDTPALIAALAAVPPPGGVIYFPPGVFLFGGTGAANGPIINRSNITIQGAGPATRIIARGPLSNGSPTGNMTPINFSGTAGAHLSNITVRDLCISGVSSGGAQVGTWAAIYFNYVDHLVVRDCSVENVGGDGQFGACGIWAQHCDKGVITTNRVSHCGYTGVLIDDCTGMQISDNTIQACGNHGINANGICDGLVVRGNRCIQNGFPLGQTGVPSAGREGRCGITLSDNANGTPNTAVIADNFIDGNGDHGILVIFWNGGSERLDLSQWKAISITGNTIVNHMNWPRGGAGVQIEQAKHVTVSGNSFYNNRQGVNVHNGYRSTISNNMINSCSKFGISLGNATQTSITSNSIYGCGFEPGFNGHGIDFSYVPSPVGNQYSTDNVVSSNRILNCTAQDINIQAGCVRNLLVGNVTSKPVSDANPPQANTFAQALNTVVPS